MIKQEFNDAIKQRNIEHMKQILRDANESKNRVFQESCYHLMRLSERRYAVIKVTSWCCAGDIQKGYLSFVPVAGLEKVTYTQAIGALHNLNNKVTQEADYDPERRA